MTLFCNWPPFDALTSLSNENVRPKQVWDILYPKRTLASQSTSVSYITNYDQSEPLVRTHCSTLWFVEKLGRRKANHNLSCGDLACAPPTNTQFTSNIKICSCLVICDDTMQSWVFLHQCALIPWQFMILQHQADNQTWFILRYSVLHFHCAAPSVEVWPCIWRTIVGGIFWFIVIVLSVQYLSLVCFGTLLALCS